MNFLYRKTIIFSILLTALIGISSITPSSTHAETATTASQSSIARHDCGERINPYEGLGAPLSIYLCDGDIVVYAIGPNSVGRYLFTIRESEIESLGIPTDENVLLHEDINPYGGFVIFVSRLTTGEFQLNTFKDARYNPPNDIEPYIVVWRTGIEDSYTLKH